MDDTLLEPYVFRGIFQIFSLPSLDLTTEKAEKSNPIDEFLSAAKRPLSPETKNGSSLKKLKVSLSKL